MKKILIGRGSPLFLIRHILFLVCAHCVLHSSEIPNFNYPGKNKGVTFLLTTPKSGSNLISGSLSIITRKPISWLNWKNSIFDPSSNRRNHPSYNRLNLPLVSNIPLLYRTHYEFDELMKTPSSQNKLIFVTRNPKELLYRRFFLEASRPENPSPEFIENFLKEYLMAFRIYHSWAPENRSLVFYEDFINQGDEILLQLLQFMDEEPVYLDDFLENKQEYLSKMLDSYQKQHRHNSGGASSRTGPTAIYYSKDASYDTLLYVDELIKKKTPQIWELYLNRFQTAVP